VLVCAHRDPIRVFLILTARLALPPPSLNFNFRPPSSALRFLRLLRVFAAILPNSVLRLLLPLCQRSVVSVTKSDSDFRAFCASSRPTFQTFSPRITRIARIKNQAPFSLFPPVKSVLCTLSSIVCRLPSVLRRPSPASSVSALRDLCDKNPTPPSAVRCPSSVFSVSSCSNPSVCSVCSVGQRSVLRPPILAPCAPFRGESSVPRPPFLAPCAPLRGQPSVLRLLLPLCPPSVTSVTKIRLRFLRLVRLFAANPPSSGFPFSAFPTLQP